MNTVDERAAVAPGGDAGGMGKVDAAWVMTFAAGIPALLLLAHPYLGIYHDAIGYSLQALKHLEPAIFDGDLYFRHGSQDRFTLFSTPFAWLINQVGLESAAHLIARVSSIALYASAGFLAMRLMSRNLALLALALFIILPGRYGAMHILSYGEDFATPRTLAEALALLSIAWVLGERRGAALLTGVLSLLIHPLVALPGCLVALLIVCTWRVRWMLVAAGAAGALILTAVAAWSPVGPVQFIDPEWKAVLVSTVDYLFIDHWHVSDWQPTVVALSTLGCVWLLLPSMRIRSVTESALIVALGGLALSMVTAVMAPVVLLIQGQAWRWLWVGKAISVLLLAPLGDQLWRRGLPGRAVLLLLLVAWSGSEHPVGLIAAVCAFLGAFQLSRTDDRSARLVGVVGGLLGLALALALWRSHGNVAVMVLIVLVAAVWAAAVRGMPLIVRLSAMFASLGLLSFQCHAAWFAAQTPARAPSYDAATIAAFDAWRAKIRPDQTVLNPTRPESTWFLLHRRSFGGHTDVVFARDAALAAAEREHLMRSVFPELFVNTGASAPGVRTLGITADGFHRLCANPELDFLVIRESLPYPYLSSRAPPPFDEYRLYACVDERKAPPP